MRSEVLAKILAAGALSLGCDARIPFANGRPGPPERAAWQVRLAAPGRLESTVERKNNGALVHLLVTGSPGRYEVSANVSGSSCEGVGGSMPVMEVQAEETSLARWSIAPGMPAPYVASFALEESPRRLDFLFTNALSTDKCYRTVSLHSLQLIRKR